MNNLGQLAMEVMDLILDNITSHNDLYHCALINKHFYTASIPRLWREPCITSQYNGKLASVMKVFGLDLRHCLHPTPLGHYIRKLVLWNLLETRRILPLLTCTPLLEDLSLECQGTDIELEYIGHLCPNIKRLKLHGYNRTTLGFTVTFGRFFPQLRDLDLESCCHLTPIALQTLETCPLESLAITSCPKLKGNWITTHLGQFKQLNRLHLQYGINDSFFRQLLPTMDDETPLPLLTDFSFYLTRGIDISTAALTAFFDTHPLIKVLTLRTSYLEVTVLENICNSIPRTIDLRLTFGGSISSLALCRLIKNCSWLSHVDLTFCRVRPHPLQIYDVWPNELYQQDMDMIRQRIHLERATGVGIDGMWNK